MSDIGVAPIHTEPHEKIVAYFSTRNLYPMLPAAYNSLIAFTPDVRIYCFIEDDKLPFKTPEQITCINVSGQTLFPHDGPNYKNIRYSHMILLKSAMTKLFPDADMVLILDVDTIVCDDISPLWDMNITTAYYAAVKEPHVSQQRGVPYANFGVVMLNLDKLRNDHKDDDIIRELNTRQHQYPEQDAFNIHCGKLWDPLPPDYNDTHYDFNITGTPARTVIRHFAGFTDWHNVDIVRYWLNHTKPYPRYVVYAGDHRVYDMMLASSKSLLANSPVDRIFFLIEHDTFPTNLPPVYHCINVSNQSVFPNDGPNIMRWYSFMTTLRAGLTKLLPPDIDRVLWLDPDTVVVDDISDIWNTPIQSHFFAAVEEVRNHNHTLKPYFNAGVMLMNLRNFRLTHMDDIVINEINSKHYEHLEQDALNYLCFNHIRRLPSCYSDSFVSEPCKQPRIKHFLAYAKPQFKDAVKLYQNMSFELLMDSQKQMKGGDRIG